MGEANAKLEAKKKKFEECPEEFIDNDEVVMAIKVSKDGELAMMVNPNQARYFAQGIGMLMLEVPIVRQFVKVQDIKAGQRASNRIVTPGGNGGLATPGGA